MTDKKIDTGTVIELTEEQRRAFQPIAEHVDRARMAFMAAAHEMELARIRTTND